MTCRRGSPSPNPSIIATGGQTQWVDDGPPKTKTRPGAEPFRLYHRRLRLRPDVQAQQFALGVSDIESALRQHRAGPALAADHLKACQQLELRRIRSHNAQFALIAQHDQAVPSRDDRPLTESLLTPLTSPLQPRNKVLCAVWTAESFASAWNSPVIFGVDRSSLSEQAFGAQKSCALPLAGSGKWSMISRTLSKLGR